MNKLFKLLRKKYSTVKIGEGHTKQLYLTNEKNEKLSFWHDLQLYQNNKIFQCGIEIPKNSIAKMELSKNLPSNPIIQDHKLVNNKKEPRFYAQFPLFNYGFLPQTWENSFLKYAEIDNLQGDDDPLDIIEIGYNSLQMGQIVDVVVLGSFCLIDQGEIDWKIITLNKLESEQRNIKSLKDIDSYYLKAVQHWFINIKTYDGKKQNSIFKNQIYDLDKTLEVIHENHENWKYLMNQKQYDNKNHSNLIENKRKEFNI